MTRKGLPPGAEVEALRHPADVTRRNIPTAETSSLMAEAEAVAPPMLYPRNPDLDPQLVWRGKDAQDLQPLSVPTVPIYIQEKVLPEALIRDLRRTSPPPQGPHPNPLPQAGEGTASPSPATRERAGVRARAVEPQADLFGGFDRIADPETKLEFYAHAENWSNRMILGDSLLVMNSLAEKEGLRGQVQMIYLDPPYGIRFASNWQSSTRSRDVKEGKLEGVSREPEQIKAFRDTWKDGIYTYLSYLRDRLVVARELLSESGSIFVQIGDENVQLVRCLLDETFGANNFVSEVSFLKTTSATSDYLPSVCDYLIWFGKDIERTKYNRLYHSKRSGAAGAAHYSGVLLPDGARRPATDDERSARADLPEDAVLFTADQLQSAGMGRDKGEGAASWFEVEYEGRVFLPTMQTRWKTNEIGMGRLIVAGRVMGQATALRYLRKINDFSAFPINNVWTDVGGATDKRYVVETAPRIVERCLLMTTDPGDLVLDPTCGSGTTAVVAEQWGRRWITIDTSRVALALARTRLMAARLDAHLLRDSIAGAEKEAELARPAAFSAAGALTPALSREREREQFTGDVRQGFVLERVPHVTLKSIANNAEIDLIHEKWQPILDAARAAVNAALGAAYEEWQMPRPDPRGQNGPHPDPLPQAGEGITAPSPAQRERAGVRASFSAERESAGAEKALAAFWQAKRERQAEIDASIARNADIEYLHDRPYPKKGTVRVTGPFTVESLSPHRVLPTEEADDIALLEALGEARPGKRKGPHPDPLPQAGEGTGSLSRSRERDGVRAGGDDFVTAVLDNLAKAGVQNTRKNERLSFATIRPWPGKGWVAAEATYEEAGKQKRAAIVIGPEYGTVGQELVREAARECRDWADALVVCGFAFDPQVGETTMNLGRLTVMKARMNQELHAAGAYKAGGGNLFVVFGEPDIALSRDPEGNCIVRLKGVDIFDPNTGEVRSSGKVEEDVACWFIDTDYDGDSFFVRHAYFLGGKDPFEKLKNALKAEIDEDAWATLYRAESRPFPPPKSGRIAVKVINHYGDEAMRVFQLG